MGNANSVDTESADTGISILKRLDKPTAPDNNEEVDDNGHSSLQPVHEKLPNGVADFQRDTELPRKDNNLQSDTEGTTSASIPTPEVVSEATAAVAGAPISAQAQNNISTTTALVEGNDNNPIIIDDDDDDEEEDNKENHCEEDSRKIPPFVSPPSSSAEPIVIDSDDDEEDEKKEDVGDNDSNSLDVASREQKQSQSSATPKAEEPIVIDSDDEEEDDGKDRSSNGDEERSRSAALPVDHTTDDNQKLPSSLPPNINAGNDCEGANKAATNGTPSTASASLQVIKTNITGNDSASVNTTQRKPSSLNSDADKGHSAASATSPNFALVNTTVGVRGSSINPSKLTTTVEDSNMNGDRAPTTAELQETNTRTAIEAASTVGNEVTGIANSMFCGTNEKNVAGVIPGTTSASTGAKETQVVNDGREEQHRKQQLQQRHQTPPVSRKCLQQQRDRALRRKEYLQRLLYDDEKVNDTSAAVHREASVEGQDRMSQPPLSKPRVEDDVASSPTEMNQVAMLSPAGANTKDDKGGDSVQEIDKKTDKAVARRSTRVKVLTPKMQQLKQVQKSGAENDGNTGAIVEQKKTNQAVAATDAKPPNMQQLKQGHRSGAENDGNTGTIEKRKKTNQAVAATEVKPPTALEKKPQPQPLNVYKVGTRVRKHFDGHGWYDGCIESINEKEKKHKIQYGDGDTEEIFMEEDHINQMVEQAAKIPSTAQPSKLYAVGTRVRKQFKGHGWYDGCIKSINKKEKKYKIQYDDGDTEEIFMEEDQINQLVQQAAKFPATAQPSKTDVVETRVRKGSSKSRVAHATSSKREESAKMINKSRMDQPVSPATHRRHRVARNIPRTVSTQKESSTSPAIQKQVSTKKRTTKNLDSSCDGPSDHDEFLWTPEDESHSQVLRKRRLPTIGGRMDKSDDFAWKPSLEEETNQSDQQPQRKRSKVTILPQQKNPTKESVDKPLAAIDIVRRGGRRKRRRQMTSTSESMPASPASHGVSSSVLSPSSEIMGSTGAIEEEARDAVIDPSPSLGNYTAPSMDTAEEKESNGEPTVASTNSGHDPTCSESNVTTSANDTTARPTMPTQIRIEGGLTSTSSAGGSANSYSSSTSVRATTSKKTPQTKAKTDIGCGRTGGVMTFNGDDNEEDKSDEFACNVSNSTHDLFEKMATDTACTPPSLQDTRAMLSEGANKESRAFENRTDPFSSRRNKQVLGGSDEQRQLKETHRVDDIDGSRATGGLHAAINKPMPLAPQNSSDTHSTSKKRSGMSDLEADPKEDGLPNKITKYKPLSSANADSPSSPSVEADMPKPRTAPAGLEADTASQPSAQSSAEADEEEYELAEDEREVYYENSDGEIEVYIARPLSPF